MADDTRPRLEANYFGTGDIGDRYTRLAQVLDFTARRHLPNWDVNVQRIDPPEYASAMGNISHVWNTQKLERWFRVVDEAPDGARVLLIDGDTFITRTLDPIWEQPFDLAYTLRAGTHLPLNAGVVFVRVSPRTRDFMAAWWRTNLHFLRDAGAHTPWRLRYAGINQASLGYVLEKVPHGCELLQIHCREWNCCEWELFDPQVTRIVHVKSLLRRVVFGMVSAAVGPRTKKLHGLVKMWRGLEIEARNERGNGHGGSDDQAGVHRPAQEVLDRRGQPAQPAAADAPREDGLASPPG